MRHDRVVDREIAALAGRLLHDDLEQKAALGLEIAAVQARKALDLVRFDLGGKAESADVHADQGRVSLGGVLGGMDDRAVAADGDRRVTVREKLVHIVEKAHAVAGKIRLRVDRHTDLRLLLVKQADDLPAAPDRRLF